MVRRQVWVIVGVLLYSFSAVAAEIEYVSPNTARDLKKAFSLAKALDSKDLVAISEKDLSCDMFGMRTRLQVERDIKLYNFKRENVAWQNRGAQVLPTYTLTSAGFVGKNGKFTDEIRKLENGKFMAQLSRESGDNSVIAISKCQAK